ncbi:UDP-2,4-diacetamido-2,4,6-trideoxy-beta-L-altropyranose hydrolase [Paenibacillus sp. PAMC21692]|uniref:UDP-2,4-diacetamido-2,4, 6-trideoxy-beta-L-altropyranose hydrolase n=1 Tax=Paenibacillus sp. PAMC21692 TaxID=2762320 RepID=UPI00164D60A2|nr:UDP-2,4-diacetamido-2,4,6-trideoxy-beta-L-altropyranose hydrolase [Paenibacillus sp. PAMC21692]QNK58379.1 UDP-2,4-diacetamido-2,4,6-trideoxy-beta-L-altropyranose hydrolase [Paenibacillus sp. PAMC21692]
MNIAIRVDASSSIGMGHLMRCITLAELFKRHMNAKVSFLLNRLAPMTIVEWLDEGGFRLLRMNSDITDSNDYKVDADCSLELLKTCGEIDWLIVDHYLLDYRWETILLSRVGKLFVIDDLANRRHNCHILLDQNLSSDMNEKYSGLLPEHCMQLLGPGYTLLREQFYVMKNRRSFRKSCKNILVSFGGSDPTNETSKVVSVLRILASQFPRLKFIVLGGVSNSRNNELEGLCSTIPSITFHKHNSHMAQILSQVDLAVGAGGISLWERAYMGVPSIVITVADNQLDAVQEAERMGMIWYLGKSEQVTEHNILDGLLSVISDERVIVDVSVKCLSVMDAFNKTSIHPILTVIANHTINRW